MAALELLQQFQAVAFFTLAGAVAVEKLQAVELVLLVVGMVVKRQ